MPWHISRDNANCPSSKPYAVVKDSTGEVEGCHATREDAEDQMAALYANEDDSTTSAVISWEGVLAVEGSPTGDGRQFAEDSLTWAELPLPLRWNKEDSHGGIPHTVTVNVGRIDKIWREGNQIKGSGVFNLSEEDGQRALQLVTDKFLKGVSIDADDISDTDMEIIWADTPDSDNDDEDDELALLFAIPELIIFHAGRIRAATLCDIPAFTEAYITIIETLTEDNEKEYKDLTEETEVLVAGAVRSHGTSTVDEAWDGGAQTKKLMSPTSSSDMNNMFAWVDTGQKNEDGTYPKGAGKFPHHMVSADGKPGAANLKACSAAIGALNGARGGSNIPSGDRRSVYNHLSKHLRDGNREVPDLNSTTNTVSLVACADNYEPPPSGWFRDPKFSVPTSITVASSGRLYGHAAQWGECHIGYPGACVTPPNEAEHSYFLTGELLCKDGITVAVGQITLGTGHAPLNMDAQTAAEHYDNTGTVVADVAVGNDEFGIWVAGAIRHGVSPDRVRELRASGQLSGDWRRIGGKLRLVGLLAVNVPGFPIQKVAARITSGRQLALVAAGQIDIGPIGLLDTYDRIALRECMQSLHEHVHGRNDN